MDRLENYFKKKTENISFIELKEDTFVDVNGYRVTSDIPLPIVVGELINEIKSGDDEEVGFLNMINGMIYTIGVDHEFKHAESYIDILYSFDPKIESYIIHLGMNKLKSGNLEDALVVFRSICSINPKNIDGLYNYALALEERSRLAYENKDKKLGRLFLTEAMEKMEEIISLDEEQKVYMVYYKLGFYYKHFNQFREAKAMWEKFLARGKETELLDEIRSELLQMEDDVTYEEGYNKVIEGSAKEGLDLLIPLAEKYESWWNLEFMIGLAYRQLGQIEQAIDCFKKVLEINPAQIDSLNEVGLCKAAQGDMEGAIEYFDQGINIEPKNYEIICNRGMAKLQLGDIPGAKEDIERAYRLNPEDEIVMACMNEIVKYN